MAIIRLANNELFVWSPVPLSEELRDETDALGNVRYLVAPNSLHHLYVSEWKAAYPDAVICATGELKKKRPDLGIGAELDDEPISGWAGEIDQVLMRGNLITTETVFFHRKSGTALFTDLLQQLPKGRFSGWRGMIAKLDLMTEPEPAVPRKFRVAFTDRKAARAALDRIVPWPAEKVVMAHGTPVTGSGRAFLFRAFDWL